MPPLPLYDANSNWLRRVGWGTWLDVTWLKQNIGVMWLESWVAPLLKVAPVQVALLYTGCFFPDKNWPKQLLFLYPAPIWLQHYSSIVQLLRNENCSEMKIAIFNRLILTSCIWVQAQMKDQNQIKLDQMSQKQSPTAPTKVKYLPSKLFKLMLFCSNNWEYYILVETRVGGY